MTWTGHGFIITEVLICPICARPLKLSKSGKTATCAGGHRYTDGA